MGNLTRITKFNHFSGLTITASKSLPNSTANRYKQAIKNMKIKTCSELSRTILIVTIITCMSFSLKSQTMQTLTDTNVIFYDYIPDIVLSNLSDTLKIDINQDGLNDFQFYLKQLSPCKVAFVKTLNSNCKIGVFYPTNTDSLANLSYASGDYQWLDPLYPNRLGVKIIDGTNNYYGWVDVIIVPDGNCDRIITINKYAFCKIANYPFLYEQTTISTGIQNTNTPDNTTVYIGNSGNVIVESGKLIKNLTLTSTTGVVVASQNNINSYSANLSTAGIVHGTYIVQVQFTDLITYTKQIVL